MSRTGIKKQIVIFIAFLVLFVFNWQAGANTKNQTNFFEKLLFSLNNLKTISQNKFIENGKIEEALGHYQASEKFYHKALKLNPENTVAYLGLVRSYIHLQKYSEAGSLLMNYHGNNDKDFLITYAFYETRADSPQQALPLITKLLIEDPENDFLLDMKDYALARTGKLKKVLESSYVIDRPYRYKAFLANIAHDDDLAEYYIGKHLNVYPDDKQAWLFLVNVEISLGNYYAANRNLELYLKKFGPDKDYQRIKKSF
jgi:tetratricopeptide (TPR) repeat protein